MSYIIEFEGYSLPNKFIFKEVTIVNNNTEEFTSFFLRSPYPRQCLTAKEKNIVKFCETHVHKISWYSGIHKITDFKKYLSAIKAGDKVFSKGLQKVDILRKLLDPGVILIDLEDLNCEKVSVFLQKNKLNSCMLEFHIGSEHCSYNKAQAFKFVKANHDSSSREEHGVFEEAK